MKKITAALTLAILILAASLSWGAAAGTCTISFTEIYGASGPTPAAILTFTCTASADDASFPSTSTDIVDTDGRYFTDKILGRYITEVRTNPGTTAPQASYDIVLNDSDGIDLMGGTLANRSATASERAIPALATGIYGGTIVGGAMTLAISNNNVNSAQTVIKVYLTR